MYNIHIIIEGGAAMKITDEQRQSCIRKNECVSKESALKKLKKKIEKYEKDSSYPVESPKNYHDLIIFFLKILYQKIEASVLIETLPDYWIYSFSFEYDEFRLNLVHIRNYEVDDDLEMRSYESDATYTLVYVRPASFTVEQYAKYYEVEEGTVRQWIRRGKIRNAYKEGSEWRIPELTPPPSRGYEGAQYKWFAGIDNLPEEFEFLKDYVLATFVQDHKYKNQFHVSLVSRDVYYSHDTANAKSKNLELTLGSKEREKLELFMISHPQIRYCGTRI